MNIKYITYLLLGLLLSSLLSSCSDDDSTTTYSSASKDAQIYSFGFNADAPISADSVLRAQDSIRFIQVNKTKFAIDQVGEIIYNPDSLPYGTVLSMASLSIDFNPTYSVGSIKITTPDSIKGYLWNTTDSVNLKKHPISFLVTAPDGVTTKRYELDIRIHKIDPDTLTWTQMTSYPMAFGESKTVLSDNTLYTYAIDGTSSVLYTSDKEAMNWVKRTLSGFPATAKPESVFVKNEVFFVVDKAGNSYSSNDGLTWNKLTNNKIVTSILGVVPASSRVDDQLLVIYKNGTDYYFGKSKDLLIIEDVYSSNNQVPTNFPLEKVASFTNPSTNKNHRMLILTGGINTAGSDLSHTWLVKMGIDGLEMTPFVKNSLFKGAGISTFMYDEKLYALSNNQLYISSLFGEKWIVAPNKQKLDSNISTRTGQTVIVDTNNYIWMFGGVSNNKGVSDIWKGRLNSLIP